MHSGCRSERPKKNADLARRGTTGCDGRPGHLFTGNLRHLHALPRVSVNGLFQSRTALRSLLSGVPFLGWTRASNFFRRATVIVGAALSSASETATNPKPAIPGMPVNAKHSRAYFRIGSKKLTPYKPRPSKRNVLSNISSGQYSNSVRVRCRHKRSYRVELYNVVQDRCQDDPH
jgi:hypothetical protein